MKAIFVIGLIGLSAVVVDGFAPHLRPTLVQSRARWSDISYTPRYHPPIRLQFATAPNSAPAALPPRTGGLPVGSTWATIKQETRALLGRTDASLLSGFLGGLICWLIFPKIENLIRAWCLLPVGKRQVGSGFTTDVWGSFCPAVGILFATLISSTVDKLWARQEALRKDLVAESSLLASLTQLLDDADRSDAEAAAKAAKENAVAYAQVVKAESEAAVLDVNTTTTVPAEPPAPSTAAFTTRNFLDGRSNPVGGTWIEQQVAATLADRTDKMKSEELENASFDASGVIKPTKMGSGSSSGGSGGSGSGGKKKERKEKDTSGKTSSSADAAAANLYSDESQQQASFRCIAKHLHTLSHLVWGSQDTPAWLGTSKAPVAAYAAELASIGRGEGVDPLADLMKLHPTPHGLSSSLRTTNPAWRATNLEVRSIVQSLQSLRGERLATLESRPPLAHWIVLAFTGTSLVLGFAVVSITTRPANSFLSRLLFTCLTGSLLTVLRLLVDLAEPFDGHGYTLAAKNAAGAYLAPARTRLVAALTRQRPKAGQSNKMKTATSAKKTKMVGA